METDIVAIYKEHWSVSEVIRQTGLTRRKIVDILKKENVYEGINGPNYLANKAKKHRENMQEKYGVDNISQLRPNKTIERNKIPYEKINFDAKFNEYRKKVYNLTRNKMHKKKELDIPEKCFYTGIEFSDALTEEVNPNDPFKRTIDHKHPVIMCYLEGWSIEEAASNDNLIFVLRYVNSLKSNTTHEAFLPIANKLKEKLNAEI